jgi:hypothetical protein
VAGRALVFSNPDIVRLLKTDFIPYAGDQWYLHRQQDAVGEYFWKVVQQGFRKDRPTEETRQGVYAATPDGTLLGSLNTWSAERTLAMMTKALDQWEKEAAPSSGRTEKLVRTADAVDEQYHREPPAGGLILNVFTRIPLEPAAEKWGPNQATGRDHLWLTRDEWRSLLPGEWRNSARYPVPRAVAERLIRFHLVDNVRGEPPMWERREIRQSDLSLVVTDAAAGRLRLEGTVRLFSRDNAYGSTVRGYDARLQGTLIVDRVRDRFSRFDLLSWGEAWGEGRYTRRAPEGRFPLVIALSLAGDRAADRVPPQGSRNLREYMGTGRADT